MAASKSIHPSVVSPCTMVSTSDLLALASTLSKFVNSVDWREFSDVQLGHLSAAMQAANDLVLEVCIDSGVSLSDYKTLSDLGSDIEDAFHMRHIYEEPCPFSEPDSTCPDLYESSEFCHDENCWMPTLRCAALGRAREIVHAASPQPYIVSKTMVDEGFRTYVVGCFEHEHEAISFMLSWQGDGDGLTLRYGGETIGTVNLWSRALTFERVEHTHVPKHFRYDSDIPF